MDTDTLVVTKAMRESGFQLLQTARQAGIPVLGLFWAQFDDRDWRLFLVVPTEKSTVDMYFWLHAVLADDMEAEQSDEFILSPASIAVVNPNQSDVRNVRKWAKLRYSTEDGSVSDDANVVRRVHLTPTDAYIYYLAPDK
ncbi:MAG: hypothetical protein H7145_17595 [Akkermansiaceae bacterium]|nr:hypothetical protein [Armatimonadota bacterium]